MSEHSIPTVCVSISSFLKLLMILSLDTWFCLDEGTLWSPMISFFENKTSTKRKCLFKNVSSFIIRTHCDDQKCVSPLIKMLATPSLMVHVPLLKRSVPLSSDWPPVPHLTFWLVSEWRDANIYWCWVPSKLQIRQFTQKYGNQGSAVDVFSRCLKSLKDWIYMIQDMKPLTLFMHLVFKDQLIYLCFWRIQNPFTLGLTTIAMSPLASGQVSSDWSVSVLLASHWPT